MINGEAEPGAGPGAWLSVNATAKRLGLTPKGVRNRIDRGAIQWRPAGNQGRQVFVPAEEPGAAPGDRIARLEERLAASEAALDDVKKDRDHLRDLLREALRPGPVRVLDAFRRRR
jgi:hypothetical protein